MSVESSGDDQWEGSLLHPVSVPALGELEGAQRRQGVTGPDTPLHAPVGCIQASNRPQTNKLATHPAYLSWLPCSSVRRSAILRHTDEYGSQDSPVGLR